MPKVYESIEIIRSGTPDSHGVVQSLEPEEVSGCIVFPRTTSEGPRDGNIIITEGYGVLAPAGTNLRAVDRVRARGQKWSVEGVPADYGAKGVLIMLRRVGA